MKRVVVSIALAVVVFCGAFAPLHTVAQSSKELTLYTDALKRYLIYGDSTAALQLVNQALEVDSTYAPALHLLSRLEKNPERAWQIAEAALTTDTTDHHLLQQAGELSMRAQQYGRTKQILIKLIKESQNPDHFRLLSLLHKMDNERTEALSVLDSAETRFGHDIVFQHLRQQIYLENNEYELALKSALESVELAPYDPANHISLAEVYAAAGIDSLADVSYNQAIALDSTNPGLLFEYGRYLDRKHRNADILLLYRKLIELDFNLETKLSILDNITNRNDFYRKYFLYIEPIIQRMYELYPDNVKVVDYYISHLLASNRVEDALVMLKRKIVDNTPTIEQLDRIIEIEYYVERMDSVKYYINKGIELYPTYNKFWGFKAWLQASSGDFMGAIKTNKAALKYAEDSAARSSLWGNIGDYYYELNETKKSYAAYNKALSYNYDNASVLNNYAYHLSLSGTDLNNALKMAKRATEITPNNGTYLDTLAWVYYKLSMFEEAKKVMQQAMSFDKNKSPELALHYGDILDALGSTFMAQTYWRKALERGADAAAVEQRLEAQQQRIKMEKEGKK